MAVVTAEIRFAPKNAAWFTTNAALVLADGEIVYRSTDGKYIIGDGTTAVSGLTFYGGVSSSGLTVGTTTITGGTSGNVLYNNAGVVGEYTTTGSGSTLVLSTSPTFGGTVTARLFPRVTTITSSATPTINTDNCDAVTITALATAITSMTTNLSGTPNNFDKLIIRIKDDGTARAITWGSSFEAKGVSLPTTTVISKVLTVGFIYDTVTNKWGCVASAQEA